MGRPVPTTPVLEVANALTAFITPQELTVMNAQMDFTGILTNNLMSEMSAYVSKYINYLLQRLTISIKIFIS